MKEFDTIAAVATGMVESGISIIRVSGNNALDMVSSIFKGKLDRSLKDIKTYTMRYGHIISRESNDILDEVIVSYMKGPKSYTGEDVVEINCHGGIMSTNKILEEVVKCGARIAEPGEFTKRAFLNGRIDLTQAEAVMDIINAKTELSMKAAVMQSERRISKEIDNLRERLLEMIAYIEATVDFPEDDLEQITSSEVANGLKELINHVDKLIRGADEGKILREGLNTVIIGKPNVGKSSLLNALLMEKRAIVTKVPGTTRDIIEEYINIDGIPIKIVDTAGIRETEDLVEKIGVEKSKKKISESDLIILVLDNSIDLEDDDIKIINYIKEKNHIVVLNKSDIDSKIDTKVLKEFNLTYFNISAKTGEGLEDVKDQIKKMFFEGKIEPKDLIITNERHKEALICARQSLKSAEIALKDTVAIDLASIDIRDAWMSLGEITGDTLEEDIIDKIFLEFCIGK